MNAEPTPGERAFADRPPPARPAGPEIVLIAALAEENRVIGRDLSLPWHLPEDLRRFERLTMGHPLVMGRRTFDSLLHQFGGPLPGRRNVVVSTRSDLDLPPGVERYAALEAALQALRDQPRIFIGGGGTIYAQCLPVADRLELTLVEGRYEGDAFFPPYEHLIGSVFEKTAEERHEGFRFVTYRRTDRAGGDRNRFEL
ncbi:MAG: dihydrofolate reductase [Bacteroidetes bacterium]|nr:MAG: dihydrofolate reductase [Bacteroidota bacterium]